MYVSSIKNIGASTKSHFFAGHCRHEWRAPITNGNGVWFHKKRASHASVLSTVKLMHFVAGFLYHGNTLVSSRKLWFQQLCDSTLLRVWLHILKFLHARNSRCRPKRNSAAFFHLPFSEVASEAFFWSRQSSTIPVKSAAPHSLRGRIELRFSHYFRLRCWRGISFMRLLDRRLVHLCCPGLAQGLAKIAKAAEAKTQHHRQVPNIQ